MKPFNRINNLSLKNLKTVYIWEIGSEKPKLYHVCASLNGASIFIRKELDLNVYFRVKYYLDTPIPIENRFLVTSELKWKTEEFIRQMKFLKKNK